MNIPHGIESCDIGRPHWRAGCRGAMAEGICANQRLCRGPASGGTATGHADAQDNNAVRGMGFVENGGSVGMKLPLVGAYVV